jgi:hypothetical protein
MQNGTILQQRCLVMFVGNEHIFQSESALLFSHGIVFSSDNISTSTLIVVAETISRTTLSLIERDLSM